jgi:3-phenylpropionate/trans-cinnamate dioxygenase ferredoxin reductase subunit
LATQDTHVIVGGGLAGASAAAALRREGFDGRVVLATEERHLPYERPPLSKAYLRGEAEVATLLAKPADFYRDNDLEVLTSAAVTAIDPERHAIDFADGRRLPYTRLLLATGSEPRKLSIPGSELPGIHYLRTIDDSDAIREAARSAHRAVVVGGGWIGAEVAASLRELGLDVALVMSSDVPLQLVLGPEVGAVYRDLHLSRGVAIHPGERVERFLGTTAVEGVATASGATIEGDLVVVGIGAEPRVGLAAAAGLLVDDGVVVDAHLQTSDPAIFAAGDIASAWHPTFERRLRVEHWDSAKRQGAAAARNMLGPKIAYTALPYFYSDQYDFGMEYVGNALDWDSVVFRGDPASREFIAFWLKDGFVSAAMNANIWDVNKGLGALIESGQPVSEDRLRDPDVPLTELVERPSQVA